MEGLRVTSHVGCVIILLVPADCVDPARVKVE